MHKSLAAAVPLAAAALIAAPASAAVAGTQSHTLHFIGISGPSVNQPHGFTFSDTVYDSTGKRKVGLDLGSCVFTSKTTAFCHVTAALDGGEILITFTTSQSSSNNTPLRIYGGTGKYSGARGTGSAKSTSNNSNKTYITLKIVY